MPRNDRRPGKHEAAADRRIQVFELRKQGYSYRQIGEQFGVSGKTAWQDVQQALAQLAEMEHESAAAYRAMELARLDDLAAKAWEILEADHPLVAGGKVVTMQADDGTPTTLLDDGPRLAALDRLLRISERRAKLLGLDLQIPIVVEQPHALTESERLERLVGLLDAARARRTGPPVIDVTPQPGRLAERDDA